MITTNETICPECSGQLKYYDKVPRIYRTKGRVAVYIEVRRLKCTVCRSIHREIPDDIFPYKHYEAEIIKGVLEGLITSDTYDFEDYPCEMTMIRWMAEKSLLLQKP